MAKDKFDEEFPPAAARRVRPQPQLLYVDEEGEVHIYSSGLNVLGQELPSSVPVAPPVGYEHQATLKDLIQKMVRDHTLRAKADAEGFDNFDEANDFDIGENDPTTPYEAVFDPPAQPAVPGGGAAPPPVPPVTSPTPVSEAVSPAPPSSGASGTTPQ